MINKNNKLAVIGLGLLGSAIAERFIQKGYSLGVWNRNIDKCLPLVKKRAELISSVEEINNDYKILILVLRDSEATKEVIKKIKTLKDKLIIQMGTIGSSASKYLENYIISNGGYYLEAPVLGSVNEALKGNLLIMIGGKKSLFIKNQYIFRVLSNNYFFFGEVSQAANTKLLLNYYIGIMTYGFSISLRFINEKKINLNLFMKLLRESSLYAPTFDKKLPRMMNNDFESGNFTLSNLSKDINLFTQEAKSTNIEMQFLELLNLSLKRHKEEGLSDMDYSALHKLTENN